MKFIFFEIYFIYFYIIILIEINSMREKLIRKRLILKIK